MAGLTDEGFEPKSYADILASIEARQKDAFGADFDVSPEQPEGVMNGIVANVARELWEGLGALFAAGDPDGATGQPLTQLSAITGTGRRSAQRGRVTLALTLAAGATVPAGSVAAVDSSGAGALNRWATLTSVTNTSSGNATVTVEAEQEGDVPLPALATTIDTIATPVAGWLSVTNTTAASPGLAAESDPVLRRRREAELGGAGTSPAEAIRAALSDVPLVSAVVVWENTGDTTDVDGRPPHSVEAMVTGGADAAIAAVLWAVKARGIPTYGTATPVTVLDDTGEPQVVRFTRPTLAAVWVRVEVRARASVSDATIIAAAKAPVLALDAGAQVLRSPINCSVFDLVGVTNVPSMKLGRTFGSEISADLVLGPREKPDPSNVSVTVVRV